MLKFGVRFASNYRAAHKMRAWQIHSYGDINELQFSSGARVPMIRSPEEVLVEVKAVSLNPIDKMMIEGYGRTILGCFRCNELEFPLTLGRDFAGTIIDKGLEVDSQYKVGDSVYGVIPLQRQGSQADTVLVDQSHICHQPDDLSAVESASLLYATMTAWSALYVTGMLCLEDVSNSKVLILGASGGVGTAAVQLLKSQGAFVIGTCSTNAMPLVQSLGIDAVFDYTKENFVDGVAAIGRYDIILDCGKVGHENIPNSWKYNKYITLNSPLLRNTDSYGLLGGLAASLGNLVSSNATRVPECKSVRWGFFVPSSDGLKFVDGLIKAGKIKPVIHKVFGFDDLPNAYSELAAGHLRGKIVIDMDMQQL